MNNIFDRLSETQDNQPTDDSKANTSADPLKRSAGISVDDSPHVAPERQDSDDATAPVDHRGATDRRVKDVTQELLRRGYIDESQKPSLFRHSVTRESAINSALEPLDLELRLDTHRGVAWLAVNTGPVADDNAQTDDIAWSHPLVRRQRLTLEQSLLIALLRHAFVIHEQENGIGQAAAVVVVDDLLPLYLTYVQDSGSDSKNESRLLSLLDQLKTYGIVSEVDKNNEVTIRPMIAHLANPESLRALLQSYKTMAANGGASRE